MASSPYGVRGVITMKIISSTRSTSMRGVTLMFAWTRPLPQPTFIAIKTLLAFFDPIRLPHRSCAGGLSGALRSLRDQPELIHACGAQAVHDVLDGLVLGTSVSPDIHGLVQLI